MHYRKAAKEVDWLVEISGEDDERPSGQRKQARKWPPYDEGARIISYNVNEDRAAVRSQDQV